ncbi:MAG: hypothetical protein ACRD8O_05790, partial [Bryobacteraceae bacterium]
RLLFAAAGGRTEDSATAAGPSTRLLLEKTRRFDRRIHWRNVREYAAGAIALAAFLSKAISLGPTRQGAPFFVCAFAVVFVLVYIWRSHRLFRAPDPTSDAQSSRSALLARYDHQIDLLRRARYWYVLPLFLGMMSFVVARLAQGFSRGPFEVAAGLTVMCLAIVWLNEVHAVRTLRKERKQIESLDDGNENEDES